MSIPASKAIPALKRPFALLLLAGLACLIAAHVYSRLGGRESGSVELIAGESVEIEKGVSLVLKRFAIPRYPSGKPRQFESEIALQDQSTTISDRISINHPQFHRGYWIYQTERFDAPTERETTLMVVHDCSLPLAAVGAILLLLGALWTIIDFWGIAPVEGKRTVLRVVAAGLAVAIPLMVVARIVLRAEPPPALQSPLMAPHVGAYIASYIILLFAAFGVGRRWMAIGFVLMTVGLVLGATWGQLCWMNYWQNDPKELASLATWLVYLAYFLFASRPRAERWLRWTGAGMIIFTSTVVNFAKIFAGLHSYL